MMPQGPSRAKRVLVTGAGTGVGRGVALEFAKQGAGAESVVKEIEDAGGAAKAIRADLADIDQIRELAAAASEYLGGVDVLINNAGITLTLPFEQVTPAQFDEIYHVNIRAMFFLTQAVLPSMTEQGGGAVVNISSIHAYSAMVDHTVYAGTKGAIVAFTRTLGLELIKKGVRVNAIAPGWILIEKHLEAMPPDFDFDAAAALIPTGFIGKPSDVGRLALFLASEDASYMVGQTLMFDGGQSIVMPLTDRICELFGGEPPARKE